MAAEGKTDSEATLLQAQQTLCQLLHAGSKPSKLAPRQLCNPIRQHSWHQPLLKKGTVFVTYDSYCSKINLARSLEISRI